MRIVNAMMKRLNIISFWQFMLIMVVFAITGSLSLYITVEFFEIIGLKEENFNTIIFWPIRIILLFFIYQILLITDLLKTEDLRMKKLKDMHHI